MMAEDWARGQHRGLNKNDLGFILGALNYPNYNGFLKQPTQHYMRPFHLRSEKMDDENKTLTTNVK